MEPEIQHLFLVFFLCTSICLYQWTMWMHEPITFESNYFTTWCWWIKNGENRATSGRWIERRILSVNEWMNVVNRHFRLNHVTNRLIHPMNHLCQSVGDSASSHSDVTHFPSWTIILPPVSVFVDLFVLLCVAGWIWTRVRTSCSCRTAGFLPVFPSSDVLVGNTLRCQIRLRL